MCNHQNIRYLILCSLLGLAFSLPISDENNSESVRPTSTSTFAIKPNLSNSNLRQIEQYGRAQDLNSFLILEPIIQQPFSLIAEDETIKNRPRRMLTQAQLDEPVDVDFDMELAEVNVFRPLFRYRAQVARNVGQRQQFG